MIRTF